MAFNKNKVMDAARKCVEKGQVDRAIKEYLRVVQEDPKDVRVWLKIGDLYAKKGAKQDATDTYLKVAKFYSEQGFYLKAVAVYKQILKLDARLVEVNLKLAELYRQLGLLSDAMQHFEMVAAHFHREGKTAEALATVRQLVELDPDNVATRIKLAELYSKEEMVEEAVSEFRHACDFLRAHNRQDDFIKVAERLLWHRPDNHDLNRELATLYLRRNDARRALQKLQVCFKADPRDTETLALLAQAFQALDQKSKTVSVLKELARVLDEDGQKEQCRDVHRKILMYVPEDADSRAYLGDAAPKKKVARAAAASAVPEPVAALGSAAHGRRAPTPARGFEIASSDLPRPHSGKATGSMPIIEESLEPQFGSPVAARAPSEELAADLSLDDDPSYDTGSIAGEVHAEEIVKILTETDVYVKYGLHAKAIEHLRRVFDLDPENVEARERLKDIFVSQGREDEAVGELLQLAELAAPGDPEQAEVYLRELLALDGTNADAFDLAQRFDIDIAGGSGVELIAEDSDAIELGSADLAGGGLEPVRDDDLEFSDIGFEDEDLGFVSEPGPGEAGADSDMRYVDSSSAPDEFSDSFEFELDDGASAAADIHPPVVEDRSAVTQEVDIDQVEEMVSLDELGDDLEFEGGFAEPIAEQHAVDEFSFDDAKAFDAELPPADAYPTDDPDAYAPDADRAFNAESDAGDEFSFDDAGSFGEPAGFASQPDFDAVGGYEDESVGFDDAAPTFDVAPNYDPGASDPEISIEPAIETEEQPPGSLPAASDHDLEFEALGEPMADGHAFDAEPIADVGRVESDFGVGDRPTAPRLDDYAEDAQTPYSPPDVMEDEFPGMEPTPEGGGLHAQGPAGETLDQTVEGDYEMIAAEPQPTSADESAGTSLEDDLDEADFFVSQGLYGEARDILEGLLARYPGHPLVTAKLQDVDAMEAAAAGGRAASDFDTPRLDAEQDEIQSVQEVMSTIEEPPEQAGSRPAVLLQKPVEDEDADTHYDLGLAYKEMGLYDEAVKAFEKVMSVAGREVQCHLMIGLCHREQANFSEAIHQFKTGLHEPAITDQEKLNLYYEIGGCYEAISDPSEAVYYYEMVYKKEGTYRDVARRLETLKEGLGKTTEENTRRSKPAPEDTDAAIDSLFAESDVHGRK